MKHGAVNFTAPFSHSKTQPSEFPVRQQMNIDLHFKERDCLAEAVSKSGVGARRFGDLFCNTFAITPNRYITLRKIEYAKMLLSAKEFSIEAVANLCGFSDIYYFSKVFKKETGVAPTKYKALIT